MRDENPENWFRGAHEGAHAVAVWALGGIVTKIETRLTHFSNLDDARGRAIVAKAGVAAERILENPDISGCGEDRAKFDAAIEEIREEQGDAAAAVAIDDCEAEAKRIVAEQIDVVRAFAEPVGSSFTSPNLRALRSLMPQRARPLA